jgi:DNA polymerase-3 subunit epsilon
MNQLIEDVTFVAFDIETTGLAPVADRIVEIGAVKFRNRQVVDTFQELVDPKMPISPGAFAVNGITDEMLMGKPAIEHVLPRFISFLGEAVPVAHNAPFDVGFLFYDISRLDLEAADEPILDTCAIPKKVFSYLYSYSLESLATNLQIKSRRLHRALADAKACMEILWKCVDEIGERGHVTLEQLLEINGPALSLNTGEILLEGPFRPLKEALESGSEVEIVYEDARGSMTTRQIIPLAMGLFRGTIMMEAFCHLRKDKRNFRLDRIIEIR